MKIFSAPIHRRVVSCVGRLSPVCLALSVCSCTPSTYSPELATQPYPAELHTTNTVDIQCFRRGTELEIVNSTSRTYENVGMWINQRYYGVVPAIRAGAIIRVSLWDFFDYYGHRFYAGGLFRSYPAEPVRLVEIQSADDQPLVGLIAIRSETVVAPERQ